MSTVTYAGDDGPPIPGEVVVDADVLAQRVADLEAQVDALLAVIEGA